MINRQFGRYVLEERIAMGGMAEIYRAHTDNEGFQKRVCIKCILPHYLENEDFVRMFRDEAALAARLQHGNIVQVFDFGEVEGSLFLAMEFVDGADLKQLMMMSKQGHERFRIGQCLQLAVEVCRGLHHAHTLEGLNIVHRDISPHNILLGRNGEVKVTDFGIAKAQERITHTAAGVVKGKLSYMAPEQAEGSDLDHRVDQFATAVVLWEMLTNQRLFGGSNDAEIFKKLLLKPIPAPSTARADVPAELDAIVMRALSRNPEERFASMHHFERALSKLLFTIADDPAECDLRPPVRSLLESSERMPRRTAVLKNPVAAKAESKGSDSYIPSLTEAGYENKSEVFAKSNPQNPTIDVTAAVDLSAKTLVGEAQNETLLHSEGSGATSPTRTSLSESGPATIRVDESLANEIQALAIAKKVDPPAKDTVVAPMPVEPTKSSRAPLFALVGLTGLALALVVGLAFVKRNQAQESPAAVELEAKPKDVASERRAMVPLAKEIAAKPQETIVAKNETPDVVEKAPPPPVVAKEELAKKEVEKAPTKKEVDAKSDPPKNAKATHSKVASASKDRKSSRTTKKKTQAKAKATGTIFVDTPGTWAKVSVAGKSKCDTPCTITLREGKHLLRLAGPTGKTSRRVQIIAGKRGTLVVK